MLSISKVGLTSEKPFQGLMWWVWSLHPSPTSPPFFLFFNANISFYSVCLRPVMIDIVPVQALSEWIEQWWLEWCGQNSFFSWRVLW